MTQAETFDSIKREWDHYDFAEDEKKTEGDQRQVFGKGDSPNLPARLSSGYPCRRKTWQLFMRLRHAPFPDSEVALGSQHAGKGGGAAPAEGQRGMIWILDAFWGGTERASEPSQPGRES